MFKLALLANFLETTRMAEATAVKEVVTVNEDKAVEVKQELEGTKETIAILNVISARKRDILQMFAQNRYKYQRMTIRAAKL